MLFLTCYLEEIEGDDFQMPKVSVIMGVYKERPDHLKMAIDSILMQSFSDFEFIIILDNPSNTELLGILQQYEKNDNRICLLINKNNIGLAESLNAGIKASKGEYIARMDADDYSLPNRFTKQVEYLEANQHVSVLGTNKILIDSEGKELGKAGPLPTKWKIIKRTLPYSNIMVHPSVMMRKNSLVKLNGYRNIPLVEDADLWLICISYGYVIGNLDEYLVKYRINYQGVSLSQSYKQAIYGQYIRKLFSERASTNMDSFSTAQMQQFVEAHCVDDASEAEKYGRARKIFEEGRIDLKKKRIIRGLQEIVKSYNTHPLIKDLIKKNALNFFLKRLP